MIYIPESRMTPFAFIYRRLPAVILDPAEQVIIRKEQDVANNTRQNAQIAFVVWIPA